MSEAATINPFETFLDVLRAWAPAGIAAPQQLTQAILPGWSLITVNEGNSSAPDTERAVVAKASYGRQLGKIIDAVEDLIGERSPDAEAKPSYEALHALAQDVAMAKIDAAKARISRLRSDLALLKDCDVDEYRRQKDALTAFFAESSENARTEA